MESEFLYTTHQSMKKIVFARALRKAMTETETILWEAMRGRRCEGFKFRRQVPLGQFIVDFCCMQKRLILEIDGGIHQLQKEYDAEREDRLIAAGFRILRFQNEDVVRDFPAVLQKIRESLGAISSCSSSPSPFSTEVEKGKFNVLHF